MVKNQRLTEAYREYMQSKTDANYTTLQRMIALYIEANNVNETQ